MTISPLGKITVTTAGTPVQITATPTACYGFIVSPDIANAGATHFGVAGLVKATRAGVIRTFLKPAATGEGDYIRITSPGGNILNLADYWIDAETSADAMLVSYITV
jgi:hypothetical protein